MTAMHAGEGTQREASTFECQPKVMMRSVPGDAAIAGITDGRIAR